MLDTGGVVTPMISRRLVGLRRSGRQSSPVAIGMRMIIYAFGFAVVLLRSAVPFLCGGALAGNSALNLG